MPNQLKFREIVPVCRLAGQVCFLQCALWSLTFAVAGYAPSSAEGQEHTPSNIAISQTAASEKGGFADEQLAKADEARDRPKKLTQN